MRHLPPLLLVLLTVGCATPIPPGTGRIEVHVTDEAQRPVAGATALISLAPPRFSESRSDPLDRGGRTAFGELGAGTYQIRLSRVPENHYPDPPRLRIRLDDAQEKAVEFMVKRGARMTCTARWGEREHAFVPSAVVLPERLLDRPFATQRRYVARHLWAWRAGLPERDPEEPTSDRSRQLEAVMPPSEEDTWVAIVGPVLALYWEGDCPSLETLLSVIKFTAEAGRIPWTEPLVLKRIGPVRADQVYDLGDITLPVYKNGPTRLTGRLLDREGNPVVGVVALLPEGEGPGALVISDDAGAYRIDGLPPGTYRANALAHIDCTPLQRRFRLQIPEKRERRDLRVEK